MWITLSIIAIVLSLGLLIFSIIMLIRYNKKKKLINNNSKFKLDERVHFTLDDVSFFGKIINIIKEDDKLYYDVQIGGEAPSVKYHIEENKLYK